MARDLIPRTTLKQYAEEFADFSKDLYEAVERMEKVELDAAWLHVQTIRNTHIPPLIDWVESVKTDVNSQVKAKKSGVKSAAEKNIERAGRQRTAARKAAKAKKGK